MSKTKDPLFIEYERTAPLFDLRFYLANVDGRRPYFGVETAAIVDDMKALEQTLTAAIERREKIKSFPSSPAAQKKIVWKLIDRYRASIPTWPHLIDGRPNWVPDPYVATGGKNIFQVLDATRADYGPPEPGENLPQYLDRIAAEPARPPIPELLTPAAKELLFWDAVRAIGKPPASEFGAPSTWPPIGTAITFDPDRVGATSTATEVKARKRTRKVS